MKRILIAPNSFKECSYSVDAAIVIKKSIERLNRGADPVLFPVSDGGDGFLKVIKFHYQTDTVYFRLNSFFDDSSFDCPAEYSAEMRTVDIESAKVIGLNLIPPSKRNPLNYNSAPLGDILRQINSSGLKVEKAVIGIGGTGVNDLGTGMLSRFGLKLLDRKGKELNPVPVEFLNASEIILPEKDLSFKIEIVLDVKNPLLGPAGAAAIFAPQKGADSNAVEIMERGFINILNLLKVAPELRESLSGAGGGIAAAFQLFFGSNAVTSNEFILNRLKLNKTGEFDIAITGEGRLDEQSMLNKGGKVIYDYCLERNIPVVFICGQNKLNRSMKLLDIIQLKDYFSSIEESIINFSAGIEKACGEIDNKYLK